MSRTPLRLGLSVLGMLLAAPAATNANLITNGDFSSYTAYTIPSVGAANGFELDATSGTSTNLTGWTSAGYNFLFTPTTNTTGTGGNPGSYSPQYTNYLALWAASNGGLNTWNGQGPTSSLNFIAADPAYQTGALSQTINGLIVGAQYKLSFQWAAGQQKTYTGATTEGWQVTLGSQSLSTTTVNNASQGFVFWMTQTMQFTATAASETLSFLATGGPTGVPPFALLANADLELPEPGTLSLLAVGLAGFAALRRRRR